MKNYVALIDGSLSQADDESLLASQAIEMGNFTEARRRMSSSKSHIVTALGYYREGENVLTEREGVKYKTILELYGTSYDLSMKFLNWMEANMKLEGKEMVDEKSALMILPEMEIFADSSRKLADDLGKLAAKLDFAIKVNPAVREWFDLRVKGWGLGLETMEEYIDILEGYVQIMENVAGEYEIAIQDSIVYFNLVHVSVDEREIPLLVEIPPVLPEVIPPDLAQFFEGFDADGDGKIDLGEAGDFFYWMKNNILYRWDDEYDPEAMPGDLVGDGRPGPEYWQTPYETWIERAGDCEDMAILNVDFYNYFEISAYVATVSTKPNGELDHAICVGLMGGSPEEFAELLGELVYYEFEDGYYMLVDPAYSEVFGYLHQGLERGAFEMKPYIDGQFLFTLEEVFEMHRELRS